MATNLYLIQPADNIGVLDTLPLDSNVRWNLAGTEFIVEFTEEPVGVEGVLTHEQALAIMSTEAWQHSDLI